jgi:hypothetical protein
VVTIRNAVFWAVTTCGCCKNRRFGETYRLADYFALMEAINSSETSVFTRATRRLIPENGIIHSHRRENLKSYIRIIMGQDRLA